MSKVCTQMHIKRYHFLFLYVSILNLLTSKMFIQKKDNKYTQGFFLHKKSVYHPLQLVTSGKIARQKLLEHSKGYIFIQDSHVQHVAKKLRNFLKEYLEYFII